MGSFLYFFISVYCMKKWWLLAGVFVLMVVAGYVYFTATREIEIQEASPLEIKDAMDTMDAATKAEFEKQVEVMKDALVPMDEGMPKAEIVSRGAFFPRAHDVKGNALIIDVNGQKILRFEDFETINGPELHIYLSSELGDSDFIDLGKIKATKGNVNYEIPPGIDVAKYNKVLVWCKPFRVLFSYAMLE